MIDDDDTWLSMGYESCSDDQHRKIQPRDHEISIYPSPQNTFWVLYQKLLFYDMYPRSGAQWALADEVFWNMTAPWNPRSSGEFIYQFSSIFDKSFVSVIA